MTLLRILAVVVVSVGLAWAGIAHLQQTRREARDARDAAQKAEQRQRDEAELAALIESEQQAKRERAARQHALAGALMLRQALKDPISFDLQSAVIYPHGAACYRYRAKGYSFADRRAIYDAKLVLYAEERMRSFLDYWSQFCAGDGGREVADALKASALYALLPPKPKAAEQPPANTDAVRGAIVVPRGPNESPRPRLQTPKP